MISLLRGKIIAKHAPHIVLDVGGVGYEILLTINAFHHLPDVESEVILHTHLAIREDEHLLYGFTDLHERELFRKLIKVSGIGPKTALAILSSTTPELLISYVAADDALALSKMPGIGKKTAQRLIIEMRDKLATFVIDTGLGDAKTVEETKLLENPVQDAISALEALGYSTQKARQAVHKVKKNGATSDVLIRLALAVV